MGVDRRPESNLAYVAARPVGEGLPIESDLAIGSPQRLEHLTPRTRETKARNNQMELGRFMQSYG